MQAPQSALGGTEYSRGALRDLSLLRLQLDDPLGAAGARWHRAVRAELQRRHGLVELSGLERYERPFHKAVVAFWGAAARRVGPDSDLQARPPARAAPPGGSEDATGALSLRVLVAILIYFGLRIAIAIQWRTAQ